MRSAVRGSPRPERPGGRGHSPVPPPGSGAEPGGGFPEGCPGTISTGGCVSRGRAPLAEHWAAVPAPALSPAVPAGERESGGKRVKGKQKQQGKLSWAVWENLLDHHLPDQR